MSDAVHKFIDCWNVYAGLYFETDGKISRRMDAMHKRSEMCWALGEKNVELAKGIVVEPDYFPILGRGGEFDWIMGFSLTIYGHPMGKITNVSVHFGNIIISSEAITIAFNIRGEDLGKID